MNKVSTRAWSIFGTCSLVLASALAWTTTSMLNLQAEKARAQSEADHQIALSTALWRMDSWLAPQLAQEAIRPYFQYQSYFAHQKAYNRLLGEIGPGEVYTPSPLLTFRSDLFSLHFQIDADNKLTSPQVPVGNYNDIAQVASDGKFPIEQKAALLRTFEAEFQLKQIRIDGCRTPLQEQAAFKVDVVQMPPLEIAAQQRVSPLNEYLSRGKNAGIAQNLKGNSNWNVKPGGGSRSVDIGPLLPIWSKTTGEMRLLYLRRVTVHSELLVQGILTDWPRLRASLLEQIEDLFPPGSAKLIPRDEEASNADIRSLATVPALLESTPLGIDSSSLNWSATHTALAVAWIGLLVSLTAVGFTMRSTLKLGERQARFASAVTHELRTPLTTFRMYSEMLAADMVQDPKQRKHYLETLKAESDRLSRLVENVLSYSRLEEGRYNTHPETVCLQDLVDRVVPVLERRTLEAKLDLCVEVRNGVQLKVDVDAVTQILFNLVDNACKYAPTGKRINLLASHTEGVVTLTIRDHGPGISPEHRTGIFKPFERGGLDAGNNEMPGIGLGLALARGLAEDLGGKITLKSTQGEGAAFTLELPLSS